LIGDDGAEWKRRRCNYDDDDDYNYNYPTAMTDACNDDKD